MRVLTLSLFATVLSMPAFAADLGTYRPGTPYHSIVAPAADICDSQCAGDAQCRGWNYVKPNPQASGVCEFLTSVSTPIASQISISGVNGAAASYSSRLTSGGTNTLRVGTQVSRNTNTTTVGQSSSGRRIVRQAPQQRIATQTASTHPVENLSLTEQQNRFRQGVVSAPQAPVPTTRQIPGQFPRQFQGQIPGQFQRPVQRQVPVQAPVGQRFPQTAAPQRPVFRQHLDSSVRQPIAQPRQQPPFENPQFQQPQGQQQQQFQQGQFPQPQFQQPSFQQPQIQKQQAQQPQHQTSRRVTGPRRAPTQPNIPNTGSNAPRFQPPQYQQPQYQAPQPQSAPVQQSAIQSPALRRGSSRPPIGTPLPTTQAPINQVQANQAQPAPVQARPQRPQRSTPNQRLAQFTAKTRAETTSAPSSGPIALTPEEAQKSLFGRLHDDVRSPEATPSDMPIATSVPTGPVAQQELGDVLAGGL